MIVVVDNTLKSKKAMFLPKLISYLESRSITYTLVRSLQDVIQVVDTQKNNIRGVILSGSPVMIDDMPRPRFTEIFAMNMFCITLFANILKVPVLGICFGCQMIYTMFGGSLSRLSRVLCEHVYIQKINVHAPFKVQFCCRYILAPKLPPVLECDANVVINDTKYPCMIRHTSLPIFGTSFHPEGRQDTHFLLDEFITHTQNKSKESSI